MSRRRLSITRFAPRTALAAALAALPLAASPLAAQGGGVSASCIGAPRPLLDACQKSVDVFALLAPQLGTALAGGNAIIGQGGAFGRLGRLTIGLRVTAFEGALPDPANLTVSVDGPQRSDIAVSRQFVGAPAADAALAVFPGLDVGPVRVGALDALATATYIPTYESGEFSVRTSDGAVKIGYGGRLGLVQETAALPSVAVTYLRRDLPRVDLIAAVAASGSRLDDTVGVRDLAVKTGALRVVVGKRIALFGVAVGAGEDRYTSRARLGAVVNETVVGLPISRYEAPTVALEQSLIRRSVFGDLSLNLPGFRVAGEVGRTSGARDVSTYNGFDGGAVRPDDAITYYAVSVRVGS